jgi:hypothetical protein
MRFQTLRSPYTRAYAVSNGHLTLAIRARVPLDTIQSFPTLSEISLDALKALYSEIATDKPVAGVSS